MLTEETRRATCRMILVLHIVHISKNVPSNALHTPLAEISSLAFVALSALLPFCLFWNWNWKLGDSIGVRDCCHTMQQGLNQHFYDNCRSVSRP